MVGNEHWYFVKRFRRIASVTIRAEYIFEDCTCFKRDKSFCVIDDEYFDFKSTIRITAVSREPSTKSSHSIYSWLCPCTKWCVSHVLTHCNHFAPFQQLIVTATDGGSPPLSASVNVPIQIYDVNDNRPVFTNPARNGSSVQATILKDQPIMVLKVRFAIRLTRRRRMIVTNKQVTNVVGVSSLVEVTCYICAQVEVAVHTTCKIT